MKLTLRTYQQTAADAMVRAVRAGLGEPDETMAITLAAPTGAGKTIIAAAALETLFESEPALTVLWVSTDKELNEQSRDKFRLASATLAPRLTILDNDFTAAQLERGRISFINTDKLGRGSSMTKRGENRQHTIWDALNATVASNSKFLVMVDEAHLGTGPGTGGDGTLLTQLINGTGSMKRMPTVVVGISATAQRFEDRVRGTRNVMRNIPIDRDAVRASGLVKDRLLLTHPDEEIAADITLLAVAARKRVEAEALWNAYTAENDEPEVVPALLLQLPASVGAAAVGEFLAIVLEHDPSLTVANIYHTFQSHGDESFGKFTVRYGAPSDLQRITEAKVILAKDAVTTGWDAPRVEVLVSLRGTKDETVITQLIGRAVRQPLAKRVADDRLNAVNIYLPNFRRASVKAVIDRLEQGDDAVTSEVIVEPVPVTPSEDVPQAVWRALRALPTWTRPQRTARSEVERSSRVANILSASLVLPGAAADLERAVVAALTAHLAANRAAVDIKVGEFEAVDYITHTAAWASGPTEPGREVPEVAVGSEATLTRNILDIYKSGISRYPGAGGSAGKWLWNHLCADETKDPEEQRLVIAALSMHPDTTRIANDAAASIRRSWVKDHMLSLSTAEQADLYALLEESTEPEQVTVQPPVATQVKQSERTWPKHLLVAEDGRYPDPKSNTWESRVLETELVDGGSAIAWYRNPTAGRHALGIPYDGGTLYPDFLFFRQEGETTLVDIVDPHRPNEGDTQPKWVALAGYAEKATSAFVDEGIDARVDRVLAVIEDSDKHLLAVNLTIPQAARAMGAADDEDAIRRVFEQFGGRYG